MGSGGMRLSAVTVVAVVHFHSAVRSVTRVLRTSASGRRSVALAASAGLIDQLADPNQLVVRGTLVVEPEDDLVSSDQNDLEAGGG